MKNIYAPKEEKILKENNKNIPQNKFDTYTLFNYKGVYFTAYYCYELADISARALFKSKIDILFACEWNSDVNYFANIVESCSRDLHCYFVQSNTSQYGDSRITMPVKTEKKDLIKIKGGDNIFIIIGEVDINSIRDFQKDPSSQKPDKFKQTPPNFNIENVKKRENNEDFK